MSEKHEKLAERLVDIIIRLNSGERLNIEQLATTYRVSKRTIQRDFNRLSILNFVEMGKHYRLNNVQQGHLSYQDIQRFANFASIQDLLPETDRNFFLEQLNKSVIVKGVNHENITERKDDFYQIKTAINNKLFIEFDYTKIKDKYKVDKAYHYAIEPYRLLNKKGVWYVVGIKKEMIKAFCFTQMTNIVVTNTSFVADNQVTEQIYATDSIYYAEVINEIVLQVSAEVSGYFERRKLLPNQEIIKRLDDGGLLLACKHVSPREVFPHVKGWIPHVRIINPTHLQVQMETELRAYLNLTF